jgi:hypothetical protein
VKEYGTFDITAIDNSNVAVSGGACGNKIHLIDVDCLQLTRSINIGDLTYVMYVYMNSPSDPGIISIAFLVDMFKLLIPLLVQHINDPP